nr:hypothetical transcript [Hymenolepis microstoma]
MNQPSLSKSKNEKANGLKSIFPSNEASTSITENISSKEVEKAIELSQQLAKNLRVPYISPAKAIEWLLRSNNHSVTELAKKIYKTIKSDSNLPNELIVEALRVAFLSPQVQARGYILDNFPLTPEQSKLLMATPFRPMLVLDLHNDQCHHPAGDMNWLENINNEEPSDCPFLKIWLQKHNRPGEGSGAVGHEGRSASLDTNQRIRDYKPYRSDSGRSGRSGTADRHKRDKLGRNIGSDKSDYDEFGNKIRGGKSDRGRQKGKSEGRDDAKGSKKRDLKRLGSTDRESGDDDAKGSKKRGPKRFGPADRESENDDAKGSKKRGLKRLGPADRESEDDDAKGSKKRGLKRLGPADRESENDDAKGSKKRGLKRLGPADKESGRGFGKDGSTGRFRRKHRESEDSLADNGPSRRHKRGLNGKRDSSYEDSQDGEQSGGKKRRKYKDGRAYSGLDGANKLGKKGSRGPGYDETKNGIAGSRRRELRRRNGSLSSQDDSDAKGRRTNRHRGRRLSSSGSSDTSIRNKGKRSARRKRNKEVSESSSSTESGQDGRPRRNRYRQRSSSSELGRRKKRREREEYSDSESTLDSDEEHKGWRGQKHGHQEESDFSSDDSHGKAKHHRKKRGGRGSSDSSYSESSTSSSDEDTSSQEEEEEEEEGKESESEREEIDINKYRFSDEISSSYDSEEGSSSDRSSRRSSKNLSTLRRLGNIFESPVGVQLEKEGREWLKKFNGLLVDHYSEGNVNTSLRKALLVMTHRMAHFMEYEANKEQNKPMNISEIGMSMEEFEDKLGEFGHFCPVKFEENDELFDGEDEPIAPLVNRLPGPKALLPNVNYTSALQSNLTNHESDTTNSHLYPHIPTELRFAVEYKGKTYRMAGPNELEKFMKDPEHYIQPNAPRTPPDEKDLPRKLPNDWNLRDSKQLAFGGFCPVCYQELSQSYEGLKVGNENILALYRDEIYAFCSEECRNKFMHRPHLYAGFKLPNKLPPKKEPLELYDLPLPGYLEQTVASTLLDALAACSKFRPKYPFISPERSALIYLALQLKALNPSSPDYLRHRARQRVYEFEKSSDIIDNLAKTMPVDYIPEQKRSEAFNKQLEAFLSLRDQSGNENHQTDFLGGR